MVSEFSFQKIAYIIYLNDGPESGVFKKIVDTLRIWIELKINTKLFVLTSNAKSFENLQQFQDIFIQVFPFNGHIDRYKKFKTLSQQVIQYNPDLVYFRYQSFSPDYLRLAYLFPVFVEINSDEMAERLSSDLISYTYNLVTRSLILTNATGCVFVSPELARKKSFKKFKKPNLVLGNGIDLRRFKKLPRSMNKTPQLVFLGTPGQSWHGIDKIVKLAKLFPDWLFHIIGPKKTEFEDVPKNVIIHGFLSSSEYISIYKSIDIGIGTLALHRKGYSETSAIKILEYLAYGIPVILGYKETNFPKTTRFILRLPNCEQNIEPYKRRIKIFVNYWMNHRVDPHNISSIDSISIEHKRFKFFEEIISTRNKL